MTVVRQASRLHWNVHEIQAGASAHWERAGAEGCSQVLFGSCSAEVGGETGTLDTGNLLWHRYGERVTLKAAENCAVLVAWAMTDGGSPLIEFIQWGDIAFERINSSLVGRSVGGDEIAAWRFEVDNGYAVIDMQHEEEQVSCALAGRFEMTVGADRIDMDSGVIAHVPTWFPHGGVFEAGPVELLEVFCPPRLTAATRRPGEGP
jgi:quercetin dioxygenase-like cupin family protein